MPGGFAHLTAISELRSRLDELDMPGPAMAAVAQNLRFCELGAVSPDYPYLAPIGRSKDWADRMHYERTGGVIRAAARRVRDLDPARRGPALAWLLGYTSHVALDLSIHPVVERRVGPYQGNEKAHRDCEMHQDVHVFERVNLGGLGPAAFVRTGIAACDDSGHMDAVAAVFEGALADTHPDLYAESPPNVALWHEGYTRIVDVVDSAIRYVPFARHLLDGRALLYPEPEDVNRSYIDDLDTPRGRQGYDAVFDWAVGNVGRWWEIVARGVFDDPAALDAIVDANLDTGRIADAYVFWTEPAVA